MKNTNASHIKKQLNKRSTVIQNLEATRHYARNIGDWVTLDATKPILKELVLTQKCDKRSYRTAQKNHVRNAEIMDNYVKLLNLFGINHDGLKNVLVVSL